MSACTTCPHGFNSCTETCPICEQEKDIIESKESCKEEEGESTASD
jgi:hypothetical protein